MRNFTALKFVAYFIAVFSAVSTRAQLVPDADFKPQSLSPHFEARHPVVLFDQAHNNLKSDDGRYLPLTRLLESDGFEVLSIRETYKMRLLRGKSILYISAPQGPVDTFSAQEIQTIDRWVKAGGSLLVMTDHPPIGDCLRPLLKNFGVTQTDATTIDQVNFLQATGDKSHLVISREAKLIPDHSITVGLHGKDIINRVIAFTGRSVKGPKNSVVVLRNSSNSQMQYRDGRVLPLPKGFSEAVAFNYGKGKVVVFGDGTFFTSKKYLNNGIKEGMNFADSDNVQLALNTFRWLATQK